MSAVYGTWAGQVCVTVRELSAQRDAGELNEANGLGHGLVWLD